MLEPVTLAGIVSCVLSLLCGSLNLIRGVHAIESILQVICDQAESTIALGAIERFLHECTDATVINCDI